jgi:hypothetical protein
VALMAGERQTEAQKQAAEIEPWDSDHTALVHVLWAAKRQGVTISDADDLAQHIMCSKWMKAVRLHVGAEAAEVRAENQAVEIVALLRSYANVHMIKALADLIEHKYVGRPPQP